MPPPFATGLQELLGEGSFVDVRISCSDHSPSDGLGSHKIVLAGASPELLGTCLDTGEEEDLVCILLPDFSSSLVASVLSILYYGEVWLSNLSHHIETVNSLFRALGLDMIILRTRDEIKLVKLSEKNTNSFKKIKMEPCTEAVSQTNIINIKKEVLNGSAVKRGFFPTVETATVPSSSLLKCPYLSCEFHAETIPEMQTHIYECKQNQRNATQFTESVHHVDIKPVNLSIKREQTTGGVKLESLEPDPLERSSYTEESKPDNFKTCSPVKRDNLKLEIDSEEEVDNPDDKEDSGEEQLELEDRQVQCVKCPYSTRSLSALQAHVSMHQRKDFLKETKNTCPVCNLKVQSLAELKKHMLENYSRQDSSSSCSCLLPDCRKIIPTNNSSKLQLFYHHVLYEHFGSKYKLKCDFCSFRSISSSRLKDHLMLHADERPYSCSTCHHGFRSRTHLTEHEAAVHRKEKMIECSDCNLKFSTQQLLNKHNKQKHSNDLHPCDVCEKLFLNKSALRCHRNNVHNAKPSVELICVQCGDSSPQCRCKGENGEKTLFCPECGKEVFSKNLSGHMHYHRQSSLRPYICQECSKTFTHPASLKRHALIHTGEKKFSCNQCGKQFYQKVAFETHLKSHSEERITCKGCNKRFLTRYLLNFHLKSRKHCNSVYNL